ncbi:serine hydrolase [Sphingorhabdus arenilitoris]|uniref:Serine hydrolase n=1 Tax=Sphingorhabdus arenilitoris TaxID=1490041 RepID=A0ABV8RJB3_9SPHN
MKKLVLAGAMLCLSACATATPPANASASVDNKAAPKSESTAAGKTESAALDIRIPQLSSVLKGEYKPEDYFTEQFLAAVPQAQLAQLSASIIAQYGQPLTVIEVKKTAPDAATLQLEFEKAIATFNINVDVNKPYKVRGLLATSFASKDDNFEKISADFDALPGQSAFLVEKLDENDPGEIIAARNADRQFAIGSTFKLYILAELSAQVKAGARKWSDVVPLAHRSFSSSATNRWPENSPVTLETLALQMISVSDNSATDTLLHALGRENVERKLAQIGHSAPDRTLPFLSTVEAFALKAPANADLYARYIKANEVQQRQIINTQTARLGFAQVDDSTFNGGPVHIDTIEWFASPIDMSALLNHIRRAGDPKMLEIMQVNSGIGPAEAAKWNYLGYKGGSEPGVISMSFLVQSKAGDWYAVSGSWNNPAKEVNDTQFVLLMTRLLQAVTG